MFQQVTLKKSNFSEKAIHLSIQKAHSHKQGNNHSLDRSEVAGSGKKLFKQKGTGNVILNIIILLIVLFNIISDISKLLFTEKFW